MTHKKHEIAVFIENEEMLKEARELLEKYGEKEGDDRDDMIFKIGTFTYPYLRMSRVRSYWFLSQILWDTTLITLPQLEEILKNQ